MAQSLLFLPDISGFTEFVQTTEVTHSQHVIAELLEVLIDANTQDLELAEIEGDALFFYKEEEVPSREKLLAQMETMFTSFYSHLKLLETNRICPCNACASAHKLELKIIAHSGELQFIAVRDSRKPFGQEVIEAHRLMKNSINLDAYVLLSHSLINEISLDDNYRSKLFNFSHGKDKYDGKEVKYLYSPLEKTELKLRPFAEAKKYNFTRKPNISISKKFNISGSELFEYITNYQYRHHWVKGVDKFEYNEDEVTRLGTEHICVIGGKHLDFITITKKGKPGQLVYGELTTSPPPFDELFQFYIISPISNNACNLKSESYWTSKSIFKKLLILFLVKRIFSKQGTESINNLFNFVEMKKTIDKH